jgi:hypothetical protein
MNTQSPDDITDPRTEEIHRRWREQPPHKGCPWCGDVPASADFCLGFYTLGCDNENCLVQPRVSGHTLKDAFARWDARAGEDAVSDMLAALEQIIREDKDGQGQSDGNFSSVAFAAARAAISKAKRVGPEQGIFTPGGA